MALALWDLQGRVIKLGWNNFRRRNVLVYGKGARACSQGSEQKRRIFYAQ